MRLMHEGFQPEEFEPNQERPAAFVFANQKDAEAFHYVESAPRINLPLARINCKNAQAYSKMAAALESAKARLAPAYPPTAASKVQYCHLTSSKACPLCLSQAGSMSRPKRGTHQSEGRLDTACVSRASFMGCLVCRKPLKTACGHLTICRRLLLQEEECSTDGARQQPQVGLVMILKNENATIYETLTSIRDGIDYWTIVDTGSTGKNLLRGSRAAALRISRSCTC